jgi:hypothetical protein
MSNTDNKEKRLLVTDRVPERLLADLRMTSGIEQRLIPVQNLEHDLRCDSDKWPKAGSEGHCNV